MKRNYRKSKKSPGAIQVNVSLPSSSEIRSVQAFTPAKLPVQLIAIIYVDTDEWLFLCHLNNYGFSSSRDLDYFQSTNFKRLQKYLFPRKKKGNYPGVLLNPMIKGKIRKHFSDRTFSPFINHFPSSVAHNHFHIVLFFHIYIFRLRQFWTKHWKYCVISDLKTCGHVCLVKLMFYSTVDLSWLFQWALLDDRYRRSFCLAIVYAKSAAILQISLLTLWM